ncbi:unnamed protein product, partial [Urochloa humidicola]
ECSRSLFWQVIRRWDSTETITEIDRICNHSKWHQHIYKHVPTVDPFERRRQRDRDRYAQMPTQQKEELLKSIVKITNEIKLQPSNLELNAINCQGDSRHALWPLAS